jgi:probable selenium-dependent hydroxylase accessory protein YqeC
MESQCAAIELLHALSAEKGLICLVGAGGKKTVLYRLAAAHSGRVGITATVHVHPFPRTLDAAKVVGDETTVVPRVIEAAKTSADVAFALESAKRGRLGGLSCRQVIHLYERIGFDAVLIKADGARGRRIKAPGSNEPQIPDGASTVIPVVSARAIGQALTEQVAHRPECVEAVTGARPGGLITSDHVARLLASEEGSLKNVGSATVVPVINMVDDDKLAAVAREAASRALSLCRSRFERVVLASMRRPRPIIDVVGH